MGRLRGAGLARLDAHNHPRRPDATESSFPPVDGTRGDGVVRRVGVVRASARRRVVLLLVRTSRARARPARARARRSTGRLRAPPRAASARPPPTTAPPAIPRAQARQPQPTQPTQPARVVDVRARRRRRPVQAPTPSPRASEGAVALASAASTTARFMGTLDADDELAPNLPDPPPRARAAVFKGTIDDGDLEIFAGGRAGGDRGESSSPAALTPPPTVTPTWRFCTTQRRWLPWRATRPRA